MTVIDMKKKRDSKLREYKNEVYTEAILGLKKYTNNGKCVTALDDKIRNFGDKQIDAAFIRDTGSLLTRFGYYFDGIKDIPSKYYPGIFEHYEATSKAYRKLKNICYKHLTHDEKHDYPYLSIMSHADCVAHSIVNQLKRDLGMFESKDNK